MKKRKMRNIKKLGIAVFMSIVVFMSCMVIPMENVEASDPTSSVYVDPNIYLTTDDLILLQYVVNQPESLEYKELINEIINVIKIKGFVNSDDLRNILPSIPETETKIFMGKIRGDACCYSFIHRVLPFGFGYFGFLSWDACWDEIDFTYGIFNYPVDYSHYGLCISFFGMWFQNIIEENGYPVGSDIWIQGRASLIFVTAR